MNICFN